MVARIEACRRASVPVLVSVFAVVKSVHAKTDVARLDRILSRLRIEAVGPANSTTVVSLLLDAGGLYGHRYAIDDSSPRWLCAPRPPLWP